MSGKVIEQKTRRFRFVTEYSCVALGDVTIDVTYDVSFYRYDDAAYVYVGAERSCGGCIRFRLEYEAIHWTCLFAAYKRIRDDYNKHVDSWIHMDCVECIPLPI